MVLALVGDSTMTRVLPLFAIRTPQGCSQQTHNAHGSQGAAALRRYRKPVQVRGIRGAQGPNAASLGPHSLEAARRGIASPAVARRGRLPPGKETAIAGELLVIIVLILVNGAFAGAEIALVSMRRSRLQELVDAGNARAGAVAAL